MARVHASPSATILRSFHPTQAGVKCVSDCRSGFLSPPAQRKTADAEGEGPRDAVFTEVIDVSIHDRYHEILDRATARIPLLPDPRITFGNGKRISPEHVPWVDTFLDRAMRHAFRALQPMLSAMKMLDYDISGIMNHTIDHELRIAMPVAAIQPRLAFVIPAINRCIEDSL